MILGAIFIGETLTLKSVLACGVILLGVILIILAKEDTSKHKTSIDTVTGSIKIGVMRAIFTTFAQAVGIILSRPILEAGADPIVFSALRLSASLVPIFLLRLMFPSRMQSQNPMQPIHMWYLILIGLLGLTIEMTLTIFALTGRKAGIVATLTSTTPIFVLPII